MTTVLVPIFHMHKVTRVLTRASKSLFLIAIVAESELEKDLFIIERTFVAFFAENFSCIGVTTR